MQDMRYKAVRKRSLGRNPQPSVAYKLRAIRALYIVVYNDEQSLIPLSIELFHLLGDILEGKSIAELEMHRINKNKVIATFDDLADIVEK